MKYECGLIEDILPLYKDDICSDTSKKIVKEHLEECPKCRNLLDKLSDSYIDEVISKEKDEVIESQSKFFKRKSALAGCIVGGIFALPILICLIANLVTGHGLTWFFIVFAAMLIPTALFVVPLMAPKNRMFLTMSSFTLSIIILLGVCCIYSGGKWFFVAASAVLFGLTLVFAPFIACRRPVNSYLKNAKGLAIMGVYTFTFVLMMVIIGLYVSKAGFFRTAFGISFPILAIIWLMFLIIRYLPTNGLVKTGVCILALSLGSFIATNIAFYITISGSDAEVIVYQAPSIVSYVIGAAIGFIFVAAGIISQAVKKNK